MRGVARKASCLKVGYGWPSGGNETDRLDQSQIDLKFSLKGLFTFRAHNYAMRAGNVHVIHHELTY